MTVLSERGKVGTSGTTPPASNEKEKGAEDVETPLVLSTVIRNDL